MYPPLSPRPDSNMYFRAKKMAHEVQEVLEVETKHTPNIRDGLIKSAVGGKKKWRAAKLQVLEKMGSHLLDAEHEKEALEKDFANLRYQYIKATPYEKLQQVASCKHLLSHHLAPLKEGFLRFAALGANTASMPDNDLVCMDKGEFASFITACEFFDDKHEQKTWVMRIFSVVNESRGDNDDNSSDQITRAEFFEALLMLASILYDPTMVDVGLQLLLDEKVLPTFERICKKDPVDKALQDMRVQMVLMKSTKELEKLYCMYAIDSSHDDPMQEELREHQLEHGMSFEYFERLLRDAKLLPKENGQHETRLKSGRVVIDYSHALQKSSESMTTEVAQRCFSDSQSIADNASDSALALLTFPEFNEAIARIAYHKFEYLQVPYTLKLTRCLHALCCYLAHYEGSHHARLKKRGSFSKPPTAQTLQRIDVSLHNTAPAPTFIAYTCRSKRPPVPTGVVVSSPWVKHETPLPMEEGGKDEVREAGHFTFDGE
jgi:hypothetical protein